jgi:peptidoglycan/LPS O-acetylase OafA/YrhL
MANGHIGLTHKIQIGVFAVIISLGLLAYIGLGAVNGFDIINQQITSNPLPVMYTFVLAISALAVYSRLEDELSQLAKQAGYTGILLLVTSPVVYIYYSVTGGPSTFYGGVINLLARILTFAGLFGVAGSVLAAWDS